MSSADRHGGSWTLLTGHGRVLAEIASNPGARVRDISAVVGLTERTVQAIVADLDEAGYISRTRTGRRTIYAVRPDSPFRHAAQDGLRIGPFLAAPTRPGDAATEAGEAGSGTRPAARQDDAAPEAPRPEQPRG
jgi:MarR family